MGDRRLLLVHAHPDDEPSMTEALKVLGTARHTGWAAAVAGGTAWRILDERA